MITRPVLVRACNDTLRATTALSLSANQSSWVEPGLVKLIYSPHISTSQLLTDTLTQLVLANAGLTEADAPWLWRGLPLVLQKRADRIATQTKLLPPLQTALTNDALTPQAAFDWGVAVLLALAQHWQEISYQPKRSILFAAWGA